jgi:hypothetical protein
MMIQTDKARQKARNDFFPKIVIHRNDLVRIVSTKQFQPQDRSLILSAVQYTLAELIFWDTEKIENNPIGRPVPD